MPACFVIKHKHKERTKQRFYTHRHGMHACRLLFDFVFILLHAFHRAARVCSCSGCCASCRLSSRPYALAGKRLLLLLSRMHMPSQASRPFPCQNGLHNFPPCCDGHGGASPGRRALARDTGDTEEDVGKRAAGAVQSRGGLEKNVPRLALLEGTPPLALRLLVSRPPLGYPIPAHGA